MRITLLRISFVTACSLVIAACAGTNYQVSEDLADLNVAFVNSKWDGQTVPIDEVCKRGGANGSSPELMVSNIPDGANAIIVEFNDQSYPPLSNAGGHGAIWVSVDNASSVTIPSVQTETNDLPQGVHIEHKHRGNWPGIGAGAYLAPCSNGQGNLYFADVKAVFKPLSDEQTGQLLGTGKIVLGRY